MASTENGQTISHRAQKTLAFPEFKAPWPKKPNMYNKDTNPEGIIGISCAENKLCEDVLLERLSHDDMKAVDVSDLYYPTFHGNPSFREAIANLLNRKLKTKQTLLAENMLVTSGVGAALDMIAHAIGDPGDCVLTPAPYYTRVKHDMGRRGQLTTLSVHTDEPAPGGRTVFRLTLDKIVQVYEQAKQKGDNVCGILLLNPHNPTGEVYDAALIQDILNFSAKESVHVVLDEIYALSVFEGEFSSSVTQMEHLPDPSRTHFVWGFSKDLSLSGYRIGVIHSWSSELINSLRPLCYYNVCPAVIQKQMTILISDTEWLDAVFFPSNHAAMLKARNHVMGWLDRLEVPYTVPSAAFFIWADFSKYLSCDSEKGELELFEQMFSIGVYAGPGIEAFYARTPGFFRILFTLPQELLDTAFERIERLL